MVAPETQEMREWRQGQEPAARTWAGVVAAADVKGRALRGHKGGPASGWTPLSRTDTRLALGRGSHREEFGSAPRPAPLLTPSPARLLKAFWPPDARLQAISPVLFQARGLDLLPLGKEQRNKKVCAVA